MPSIEHPAGARQPDLLAALPPLPEHVVSALAAAGVRSLRDWKRLTALKKRSIFGVVPRVVAQLDAHLDELARAAP